MKRMVLIGFLLLLMLPGLYGLAEAAEPEMLLLAEGQVSETPLYIFDSGVEGNTLLFVAGTHGNEDGGYRAAEIMLESLRVHTGKILLIPHANIRAIADYTRTASDGIDMNRSYPGDPEGNAIEVLTDAILDVVRTYEPVAVIDMHEGRNLYGVDGSIGNSVIVGMTPSAFDIVLEVLDRVNAENGDLTPFTFDANAPQGSLNYAASVLMGLDAFTIETPQIYDLDTRVRQQLLFVRAFLDLYGVDAEW